MDKYEVVRKLAGASFAKTLLAKRRADGLDVVIKVVKDGERDGIAEAMEEAELLKRVHHPYITQFCEAFCEGGDLHIVTEFATGGGNLVEAIQNSGLPDPAKVIEIMRMLCSALAHLHHLKLVHKGIKPQNVLMMADGSVKLGDFRIGAAIPGMRRRFGVTPDMGELAEHTGKGPLGKAQTARPFMAPELLAGKLGPSVDIWAVGVLAYFLLTGKVPFNTLIDTVMGRRPPLPDSLKAYAGLHELIDKTLTNDPSFRPSAMEILAHPLLTPLKVVCWRDPEVRIRPNRDELLKLQARYAGKLVLIAVETDEDALGVLEVPDKERLWVITNRGEGVEAFIGKVRAAGVKSQVLLFCRSATGLPALEGVIIGTSDDAVPKFLEGTVMTAATC